MKCKFCGEKLGLYYLFCCLDELLVIGDTLCEYCRIEEKIIKKEKMEKLDELRRKKSRNVVKKIYGE